MQLEVPLFQDDLTFFSQKNKKHGLLPFLLFRPFVTKDYCRSMMQFCRGKQG